MIDYIKAKAEQAGNHFFDKGTMRFFNSHILPTVYKHDGKYRFITSEQFDDNAPRLYTIREWDPSVEFCIDTVGEFQQYATRREAIADIYK